MQVESKIYYDHLSRFQNDSCLYKGSLTVNGTKREWIYDHRYHDGVSAFIKVLNDNKLFYPGICREASNRSRPNFLSILVSFLRFRAGQPYKPKAWKIASRLSDNSQYTHAAHNIVLSQLETKLIAKNAHKERVTLNAYMLFHLKELLKNYTTGKGETIFMFPVHLREALDANQTQGNEVSFLDIKIKDHHTVQDVNHTIVKGLKNRMQWGAWASTKILGFIPRFLHTLAIKDYVKKTPRTGLFTSMGHWDQKQKLPGTMVGASPVQFSHMPFSCASILWQNQLSLGIALHPRLSEDRELAQRILENYCLRLLGGSDEISK